jgi:hypothetical protein
MRLGDCRTRQAAKGDEDEELRMKGDRSAHRGKRLADLRLERVERKKAENLKTLYLLL